MPTLTIRNLSEEAHRALRLRAAQNGRSVEAEVRAVLEALPTDSVASGVTERPREAFAAAAPRSFVGAWNKPGSKPYPEGRLASEDLMAQRRLEAAYEGEELTKEEWADLNGRLDRFEIDLPWVEQFLARRRK